MTSDQHDLEACRQVLLKGMADQGVEVTVSTARPIIETPYEPNPMRCPHGTWFYMQPTSEQIAAWAKDGTW